jgi:hypothetical protein
VQQLDLSAGGRIPNSLLGAAIRMYWPGLYTVVPGDERKLFLHWADYEVAYCVGFGKASDAVIAKFWVSAYTL